MTIMNAMITDLRRLPPQLTARLGRNGGLGRGGGGSDVGLQCVWPGRGGPGPLVISSGVGERARPPGIHSGVGGLDGSRPLCILYLLIATSVSGSYMRKRPRDRLRRGARLRGAGAIRACRNADGGVRPDPNSLAVGRSVYDVPPGRSLCEIPPQ